ncbi:hypothetical protein BJV82DRAFT_712768 [Fennellomyces sp. T-0311]|nr:hypothetical protein BJV82DRAFT_712768 [Fennellomyces sp. T-0311]
MIFRVQVIMAMVALGWISVIATPIVTLSSTDGFVKFQWNGQQTRTTFTLTLDTPGRIQLVDYRDRDGDVFKVYDHGEYLGETSFTPGNTQLFASTPEEALEDPRFSQGTFPLEAGKHMITVHVPSSGAGTAAIRLVLDDHAEKSFAKKVRSSRNHHHHDEWVNANAVQEVTTKTLEWTWEDALAGYDHPLYGHPVDIDHTVTSTQTVWVDPGYNYYCIITHGGIWKCQAIPTSVFFFVPVMNGLQ